MARKMRDSGVEWIGEVPEGWKVHRFKTDVKIFNGCSISDSEKDNYTDPRDAYPYVSTKDISLDLSTANYESGLYTKRADVHFRIAPKGSILMCIEGGSAGRKKCLLKQDVSFVNKLACFTSQTCDNRYVYYFLQSPNYEEHFLHNITGLIGGVNIATLLNMPITIPPLPEQRRIADYLDEKCAAIDGAVGELKRGIEDCKAWKKAIIEEVTSVGLDDDVKLWQTELGWISNRPSYWKRNQLSSLCRRGITYGIVKLGDPCENGVKVLRCSDVKDGHIDASNVRTVTPELSDEYKRTVLSGGEVIVNVRGTLGGCAIVPKEFSGANIAREVALLDVEESKANPKFVMYTLLSSCFANYVGHEMAGAIYQGLNIATLSKYSFYAPDIKEQQAIADYLDEKCAAIDTLVAEKEKLIADLEAYKKSLIFELVTGKREVA